MKKPDCCNLDHNLMRALLSNLGLGINQHYEYAKLNVNLDSIVEVVGNLIPPAAICSKFHNLSAFQSKVHTAQTILCEWLAPD
jgi:hypothetical protein